MERAAQRGRQGKAASRMRKRTALREIEEQRASWEILAGSACSTNVKKWPISPQPGFYRIVSRQKKCGRIHAFYHIPHHSHSACGDPDAHITDLHLHPCVPVITAQHSRAGQAH